MKYFRHRKSSYPFVREALRQRQRTIGDVNFESAQKRGFASVCAVFETATARHASANAAGSYMGIVFTHPVVYLYHARSAGLTFLTALVSPATHPARPGFLNYSRRQASNRINHIIHENKKSISAYRSASRLLKREQVFGNKRHIMGNFHSQLIASRIRCHRQSHSK